MNLLNRPHAFDETCAILQGATHSGYLISRSERENGEAGEEVRLQENVSHGRSPRNGYWNMRDSFIFGCAQTYSHNRAKGQPIVPRSLTVVEAYYWQIQRTLAKLWRDTTTRKPMLLFLLFGWLLLRIETRALFSLLFHEPPRRPYDPCPDHRYESGTSLACFSHAPNNLPISAMPREACSYCLMVNN